MRDAESAPGTETRDPVEQFAYSLSEPDRLAARAALGVAAPGEPGEGDAALRAQWLEGYEWALTHLTDPGVLADAREYALAHETAETTHGAFSEVVPHGGDSKGVPAPPAAASSPHPAPVDYDGAVQADLREIMGALGIGIHARNYSPHEVVQREVLPAIAAARAAGLRATIEALCAEVDGWHVYETRDIGDAYLADAVQEFVADIRAAASHEVAPGGDGR